MCAPAMASNSEQNSNSDPQRRRRRRGSMNGMSSSLTNSLRSRNAGIASTGGRLAASFSDAKGLDAATIGDILSADFEDDDTLKDLPSGPGVGGKPSVRFGAGGGPSAPQRRGGRRGQPRGKIGPLGKSLNQRVLATIESQRSLEVGMEELLLGDD
mmetsp:Transcript_26615/g.60100  ORF Transcript_26615/g.60100 Transcript_26615/m.60100 type:complete len:156 (-) Transcript_26615:172-639(-)